MGYVHVRRFAVTLSRCSMNSGVSVGIPISISQGVFTLHLVLVCKCLVCKYIYLQTNIYRLKTSEAYTLRQRSFHIEIEINKAMSAAPSEPFCRTESCFESST